MIVRVSARSSQQWCWQWGVLWEIPGCAKSIFGSEEIHDFSMEVFFCGKIMIFCGVWVYNPGFADDFRFPEIH
jgi:hypothetical protein